MKTNTNVADQIKEHMDVVCSKGGKVGRVDHVEGDQIKLTKNDSPDGKHHLLPLSMISMVDTQVHLAIPGDEVKRVWQAAD